MIRRARPEESVVLSELAFRSKAHWGYDGAFMQAHREGLSVPRDYIAQHPTFVFEAAERCLGFYAFGPVDGRWVELDYLFVEPAYLGRGIGRRLLVHACERAQDLGYEHMRIVSDPNAVGFYEQMGAKPWGEWHSPIVPGRRLPVLELRCGARTRSPGRRR